MELNVQNKYKEFLQILEESKNISKKDALKNLGFLIKEENCKISNLSEFENLIKKSIKLNPSDLKNLFGKKITLQELENNLRLCENTMNEKELAFSKNILPFENGEIEIDELIKFLYS